MFSNFVKKLVFEFWPFMKEHICLIRKWIYKEETFKHDIIIDTCNNADAVTIDLNKSGPRIWIDFNIQNRSEYLDAALDRASVSITVGYPIPGQTFLIIPCKVRKKNSEFFRCEITLNNYQYELIADWLKTHDNIEKVNISVNYFVKSSLYEFSESVRLENKACRVINYKLVQYDTEKE